MIYGRLVCHRSFSRQFTRTLRYISLLTAFVILHITPISAGAGGKQVTVYDQGLNMPMETYTLPDGWKLIHDIATDPNTGQFARYRLDKMGPRGEITRSLAPRMYGPYFGAGFEQAWQQTAQQALQDILQDARLGQPRRNGPLLAKMRNSPKIQKVLTDGSIRDVFEVDIAGNRQGKSYEGKLFVATMPIDAQSGMLIMGILVSPSGLLMKTIDTDIKIGESAKANPRYQQAQQQISLRASRQRMRANKQRFDSHQRMMKERYRSNDQQNQQWMNNFRNDNAGSAGNNGYSGQDAYIDSIHERNTFYDPDSGQNVSRDGQYEQNYTDGLGNYYGTDDPSFNPNSLQGDWQATEPLRPNN